MGIFDIFKGKDKSTGRCLPKHDTFGSKKPVSRKVILEKPKIAAKSVEMPPKQEQAEPRKTKHECKCPRKTYCGICGVEIKGNAYRRGELGIHICQNCGPRFQHLSSHETVKSCPNCGYRFLPGFSKWYYSSSEPKCIVCGAKFDDGWTFERLKRMLDNPNISQQDASDVMTVIRYGKLGTDKCKRLELSPAHKNELYLRAIKLPFLSAHYEAFLSLRRAQNQTSEIRTAIIEYERKQNSDSNNSSRNDKAISGVQNQQNSSTQNNSINQKPINITYPKKKVAQRAPIMGKIPDNKPKTQGSTATSTFKNNQYNFKTPKRPPPEEWHEALLRLPVDMTYNKCFFIKTIDQAVPYIQKSISAPSMSSVFLKLSEDGRAFILGYTNSHRHEVRRCGANKFAFTTERL